MKQLSKKWQMRPDRRSFFRYFATKDDLLALNTVHCGEILV